MIVEKLLSSANDDDFFLTEDDLSIEDEMLTVTLDDSTSDSRILEFAAIARDLGGTMLAEE